MMRQDQNNRTVCKKKNALNLLVRQPHSSPTHYKLMTLSLSLMCFLCLLSSMLIPPATRWQPGLSSFSSISSWGGTWLSCGEFKSINKQVVCQKALCIRDPGTSKQAKNQLFLHSFQRSTGTESYFNILYWTVPAKFPIND